MGYGQSPRGIKEPSLSSQHLLSIFALGTAALALWSFVRWPDAAPETIKAAVLRLLLAVALFQVGSAVLDMGVEAAPSLTVPIVVGAVIPVLTYAFLAAIWFMKLCADQMRGAV
jgi:hypothetical protein